MPLQSNLSKYIFAGLFASFFYSDIKAQKIEEFSFIKPELKVSNSLYNSITFVDSRRDTSTLGIIQTGAFNRQALVVAKGGLDSQVKNVMAFLTDSTANKNELLLQLRMYNLAEVTSGFSEKGYFKFYAHLFAKTSNGYSKIADIDTLVKLSSGMDVSNALLKTSSSVFTDFIANNLTRKPLSPATYPYNYILKIDSVEKSRLKIYTTDTYTDGVYYRYSSFSDQIPDGEVVVEGDSLREDNVKIFDAKRKLRKLTAANAYGIVFKGKPYLSNKFGFNPMYKKNNDLFFNGKISVYRNASSGGVIAAGALFGLVGALAVSAAGSSDIYDGEIKIDYLTGEFVVPK